MDLFIDRAEYAVDELAGVRTAKVFGKLDGFVDGDLLGDLVVVREEQFIQSDAQYIAVDDRDLFKWPLRSGAADNVVDLRHMRDDAVDKLPCKLGFVDTRAEFDEVALDDRGEFFFLLIKIPLVQ